MEALGIDIKLLVAQLVNFALFFFIFQRFIAKPFMQFLTREKKMDEEKHKTMTALEEQQKKIDETEKEMRAKMKKTIDAEINEAKKEAAEIREELVTKAQGEVEAMIRQAKEQIDEERRLMNADIKEKAVALSMVMVERALNEYLTDAVAKDVTNHIVKSVSKNVEYHS